MAPSAEEVPQPQTIKEKILNVLPHRENGTNGTNGSHDTSDGGDHVKETNGTQAVPTNGHVTEHSQHREPLKLSGALNDFKHFDVTPTIGREYVDVDLAAWLKAENSDELIRDLAITISQRGVVFFRRQDNIDDALQKELVQRLGELTGKPATSKLHIHPIANSERELGGEDNEISIISSKQAQKLYPDSFGLTVDSKNKRGRDQWHSDITFEPVPSDYALLRLTELPGVGGDTLWASGYELYDRFSEPYQKFLDGLTATYAQPKFNKAAQEGGFGIFKGPRGAPENYGEDLSAVQTVVRTNPVTGWKSIYSFGAHCQKINGLTKYESEYLLDWVTRLVVDNHDLQVRHRWANPNDLAIWDNRSVYHAATPDYIGSGERLGHRSVSLGERPYFDPQSKSRRQELYEEAQKEAQFQSHS